MLSDALLSDDHYQSQQSNVDEFVIRSDKVPRIDQGFQKGRDRGQGVLSFNQRDEKVNDVHDTDNPLEIRTFRMDVYEEQAQHVQIHKWMSGNKRNGNNPTVVVCRLYTYRSESTLLAWMFP